MHMYVRAEQATFVFLYRLIWNLADGAIDTVVVYACLF